MKRKQLLCLLMLVIATLLSQPAFAATNVTPGATTGLTYSCNSTTKEATLNGMAKETKTIHNLIIPDSIRYNGEVYAVTKIAKDAFKSKSAELTGKLVLPKTLKEIGENAFAYCYNLTGELLLPPNLKTIGNYAFGQCCGFSGTLILPESLNKLSMQAFVGCCGFTGLKLSNNITDFSGHIFWACYRMSGKLLIPGNIKTIWSQVFDGCYFREIEIEEGVTKIAGSAFSDSRNLETLILPSTVSEIGRSAFQHSDNLKRIICKGTTPPGLDENSSEIFKTSSIYYTAELIVPAGSENRYASAPEWKRFRKISTLSNVEQLTLSSNQVKLNVNEGIQLSAAVLPDNATIKTVSWATSDSSIAEVDMNGYVKAVAPGRAVITAESSNGISAICEVTVIKPVSDITVDVENMSLVGDALVINVGETKIVQVIVSPDDYTETLTWESSDTSVLEVDNSGTVKGIKPGYSEVKVSSESGISASVKVKVIESVALLGDADDDGKLTVADLVLLGNYIAGLVSEEDINLRAVDMNSDGEVNITDLGILSQLVMQEDF